MFEFIPLKYYAFSGLVNFITSFIIAVVLLKNPKAKANKIFSVFSFTVAFWSFFYFLFLSTADKTLAEFYVRTCMIGVFFMPSLFIHFVDSFLNIERKRKFHLLNYSLSIFFTLLAYSSLYVKGVGKHLVFPYWPSPGPVFHLALSHFIIIVIYSFYLLQRTFKRSTGVFRNQILYVFVGTALGYFGGSTNYFSWYRISIPPFLNIFVSLYVLFVAYAIVRHRLMDITFVIRDTTLRLASSLLPTVVFLTIGILFFSLPTTIIMIILTAVASPLLYRPLRKLLRPVILGGKYDYQKLLRESTKALVTMLDLRHLLNYIVNTISETVGVDKISLFLKEEGKRKYEIKASYGLDKELADNYVLKPNEGIIPWLKQSKAVFIKEEMERALPGKAFENIYGGLEKIGAEFILPLFYKDNLVGVLNLSNKQSGGIYNQTDIDILESLGAEAAVAIENARLHTEVITDELTELYQPRYFELRLREEVEKAKRYRHCLSLMMVEVDNFEEFRKRHEQEEGDNLLKSIARIVSGNIRVGDIACRCRDKGFGIILPEITEEPWGNIRERLKKQIRETVEIGERLRRRVKEEELGVTVSIGISSFDGQDREMRKETLIKQAREALSQAKREGNTVKVFYSEELRKEISTEVLEWIKETEETLVSGEICIDLTKHTVEVKGKPVKLTPKGFDLLCLLMKKKGRVLNRSFLTESIWGYEYFGTTRTVDSHIKLLRQKLGSEGKKIKTIEGIGYKFTDEEIQ